jgi:hypothetical protein
MKCNFFIFFTINFLLIIVLFSRKVEKDPAVEPKLADVLFRLAEVELEAEDFTNAIEDLKKYLEIQKASLPPDSRLKKKNFHTFP